MIDMLFGSNEHHDQCLHSLPLPIGVARDRNCDHHARFHGHYIRIQAELTRLGAEADYAEPDPPVKTNFIKNFKRRFRAQQQAKARAALVAARRAEAIAERSRR